MTSTRNDPYSADLWSWVETGSLINAVELVAPGNWALRSFFADVPRLIACHDSRLLVARQTIESESQCPSHVGR